MKIPKEFINDLYLSAIFRQYGQNSNSLFLYLCQWLQNNSAYPITRIKNILIKNGYKPTIEMHIKRVVLPTRPKRQKVIGSCPKCEIKNVQLYAFKNEGRYCKKCSVYIRAYFWQKGRMPEKLKLKCLYCGKDFETYHPIKIYCSPKCKSKGWYKKNH